MGTFLEQLKVYFKILRLNRRSTIVSFIGLGFSLALISVGLIFSFSFQYTAFSEYVGAPPTEQLTLSVTNFVPDNVVNSYEEMKGLVQNSTRNVGLEDKIDRFDWYFARGQLIGSNRDSDGDYRVLPDFNLYGVPNDYFTIIQSLFFNGTMPQGNEEVIVVAKNSTFQQFDLENLGLHNLYMPVFGGYIFDRVVNVTAAITKEAFISVEGPAGFDFLSMADYFTDEFLLMSIDDFPALRMKPYGRFSFHLDEINSFNLNGEIANIRTLSQELEFQLESNGYGLFIYDDISDELRNFQEEFFLFLLFGSVFLSTLVVVALFLTYYSSNLLQRRQKHHIGTLLARGSSKSAIWFLATFQFIEITISGSILSFVIGYPFSWIMLKSQNFLTFSGSGIYPAINAIIFYTLIIAAFTLSAMINFRKVWMYSNITILEAHDEMKEEKPFWNKFFLDVALIIVGTALWIIVKLELGTSSAFIFAYMFGIVAPICIVLGGIFFSSRIYSLISKLLGKRMWNKGRRGIFGLAILRINRRQGSAIRGLILFSLTFTLLFSALASIESYNQFEYEGSYYSLGSDILVPNYYRFDNQTKNQILAIEGVESATYVLRTTQIISYSGVAYSYTVIGIDPQEFVQTAFLKQSYLNGQQPNVFFDALEDKFDVIMQEDEFNLLKPDGASIFKLYAERYGTGFVSYNLENVGLYKYMPRFYNTEPPVGTPIYRFTIIGSYDLVSEFAYTFYSTSYDIMVKVKEGYDITQVDNALEDELERSVDNVIEQNEFLDDNFRNRMLYGSLNTSLIASIILIIAILVSIVFIQLIENESEVNLLKILGFSPKQFLQLFISESVFLTGFTIIIGTIFGVIAASMIKDILTLKVRIPASSLVLPTGQLILTILTVIVLSLTTTILTVRIIFRKDRGLKRFRFEESITESQKIG